MQILVIDGFPGSLRDPKFKGLVRLDGAGEPPCLVGGTGRGSAPDRDAAPAEALKFYRFYRGYQIAEEFVRCLRPLGPGRVEVRFAADAYRVIEKQDYLRRHDCALLLLHANNQGADSLVTGWMENGVVRVPTVVYSGGGAAPFLGPDCGPVLFLNRPYKVPSDLRPGELAAAVAAGERLTGERLRRILVEAPTGDQLLGTLGAIDLLCQGYLVLAARRDGTGTCGGGPFLAGNPLAAPDPLAGGEDQQPDVGPMTLPVSFPPIVAAPDGAWHRAVLNWFEPAAPLLEGTPGTPPCASGAFWVPLLSPEPRRIELLARALRQVEIGEGSRWPVLRRARERWGPDAAAAFEAAAAALARLVAALSDAAGRGHSVPDELVDAARGGPGGADPARWSADGWDQAAWDRAVAAAHVGFQLLYLFFFDRVEHELFRGRSRLSHTELGHTVGDLFEPDRVAWTVSVLRGTAPPDRYQGIRQLLGEWPLVREAVRRNARAIVEDFDPVAPACRRLGPLPADRTWLADLGRVWMRRGLGLGQWGSKVERALDDLDAALDQMRRGELAAEDLPRRFHDLIGIYSGNGYFNLRGGL